MKRTAPPASNKAQPALATPRTAPNAAPTQAALVTAAAALSRAPPTSSDDPKQKQQQQQQPFTLVPLLTNALSRQLLYASGGAETIIAATTLFYDKFYADGHIRPFLGELHYPLSVHARRLGLYIAEMMGDAGRPWTADTRNTGCPYRNTKIQLTNGEKVTVRARAEAHYAAWNSTQRRPEHAGRRFKLDDCRVWMRLFFWACREAGLADQFPSLFDYLVRFVGHFIRIYEQTAQPFTRHEARWSLEPRNLQQYTASGCYMQDVVGVPLRECAGLVPPAEYTDTTWPYVGDRRIPFEE